ncbi:MAG TPA: class I SAM-dependent methyltransferase [Candidatus Aminicenantes bacterium]|nr:class I SAM-dependent methyltransferase [Candidatus Aminicenantes bacterium]
MKRAAGLLLLLLAIPFPAAAGGRPTAQAARPLDDRVREFLDAQKGRWRQENVTETDGRLLHDLILERGYTRALEIGTSTGHSGIWQAWALSKTGGSLVTVEIEEFRHLAAVRNFKAAGLDPWIDARLGDAHTLVETLAGPFDFIFIDADQNWTPNYFRALLPKLAPGGCFAVHNVLSLGYMKGVREFLDEVRRLDVVETTVETSSGGGISLSFRKR